MNENVVMTCFHKGPMVLCFALGMWTLYFSQFFISFFIGLRRICLRAKVRNLAFFKRPESFFSVGLPLTVCAFVSLRNDNILQQHIDTFLETASPNFIKTAYSCRFEKISDQTKSKSSLIGLTTFRWPLRKHAIKIVFLWLVQFDPLVKKNVRRQSS